MPRFRAQARSAECRNEGKIQRKWKLASEVSKFRELERRYDQGKKAQSLNKHCAASGTSSTESCATRIL